MWHADLITVLHSAPFAPEDVWTATKRRFRAQLASLAETTTLEDCPGRILVIDADLDDAEIVTRLRGLLRSTPGKALLFVVERSNRGQYVQACALGADRVLVRPLSDNQYFGAIEDLLGIERSGPVEYGVRAGVDALRTVFALADGRADVTARAVVESAAEVVVAVGEAGLQRWIAAVNEHHNATYRHCLLVTGTAVAFGQHLRLRSSDMERLLVGALVHDLGKVAVPVEILEKPTELDAAEMAVMKTHPTVGGEMLEQTGGFSQETIDVVALHHEYLDGSGYPEGRTASSIADLVRVITIADVFSALIERRSYRAAISPTNAYEMLRAMQGRLDLALVRAFQPIARAPRNAA